MDHAPLWLGSRWDNSFIPFWDTPNRLYGLVLTIGTINWSLPYGSWEPLALCKILPQGPATISTLVLYLILKNKYLKKAHEPPHKPHKQLT